jgi:hypothetical protein
VSIIKSVPNWISYSQDFFPDFSHCLAIFPALESDFWIYFKSEFCWHVGTTCQCLCRRVSCFHWPSWAAPSCHACRHKTPRPTALVWSLHCRSEAVAPSHVSGSIGRLTPPPELGAGVSPVRVAPSPSTPSHRWGCHIRFPCAVRCRAAPSCWGSPPCAA